jgi:hypothetical protein
LEERSGERVETRRRAPKIVRHAIEVAPGPLGERSVAGDIAPASEVLLKLALERAAETARKAGVSVVSTIRGGNPAR